MLTFKPVEFSKDKTMVTVLVNGERSYYQVHDMDFLRSLTALSPQTLGSVTRAVGQLTRTMKLLTTGNKPYIRIG